MHCAFQCGTGNIFFFFCTVLEMYCPFQTVRCVFDLVGVSENIVVPGTCSYFLRTTMTLLVLSFK